MPDYKTAVIYKLCCKDEGVPDIYIGSTTNFKGRKRLHKHDCKKCVLPVYQFIRVNGGWDNWSMLVIEEYPCDNRKELHTRERYWIEYFNASLNCLIPCRSRAECNRKYYQENLVRLKERHKKYEQEHRDKRNEQKIKYRENNREEIRDYNKKYRENNREEIRDYNKEYYHQNRQKRIEQKRKYRQFKKVFKQLCNIEID
jgi:hypothetical protein